MTSPAGFATSPSIIAQALLSDLSPVDPCSPYSWEQDDAYDPNEDLLERFVVNLGPGAGTARSSPGGRNAPTARIGTPVGTSTPAATVAGVGTFTTNNIPGRSFNPPGQGYLTAAQRGQRPAVGRKTPRSRPTTGGKVPRRVPCQPTPSSPSDPGSRRRSSVGSSNGGRRGGGRRGGGGGGGDDDDEDDDDEDDTPSSLAGPSRRRRRADRLLKYAEMQQRLQQLLEDQRQTAAGRRIAGITTTNTITTTYKNGQRPSVTRNSTSVPN